MSSHREAPEISKDPVADSTDLYAFVSPDKPDTVTLIANYVPLQGPAGGPNFYEFGDDVLYEIHIDNNGDGGRHHATSSSSRPTVAQPEHVPLQHRPDHVARLSPNWNRRQFYTVTRSTRHGKTAGARHGPGLPAVQHRPAVDARTTRRSPTQAVHTLPGGRKVFAGQRAEGFYVDLGSIFDLVDLRPFAEPAHHVRPDRLRASGAGVNATDGPQRAHASRSRCRSTDLTADGKPSRPTPTTSASVIGVWTTASRQQVADPRRPDRATTSAAARTSRSRGSATRCSTRSSSRWRDKDHWNPTPPADDKHFAKYVAHPELAELLPVLYPGAFPNLAALNAAGKPRADLVAILLTGIPAGLIPGFQNFTGATQADLLRLNMAIPPAAKPEQPRAARRRPRRLPERAPARRRRRHHRAAGHRRRHLPAGRPDLHPGRGRPARSPTG